MATLVTFVVDREYFVLPVMADCWSVARSAGRLGDRWAVGTRRLVVRQHRLDSSRDLVARTAGAGSGSHAGLFANCPWS